MRSAASAALVAAAVLAWAVPAARAQDGPADAVGDGAADDADALFERAVELRKQGKLDKACPLFERSQALEPARGTLLNIARCRGAVGALLAARDTYSQLEREALAAGDDERLAIARRERADVEARLGRVVIDVPAAARVDGLVVELDGEAIAIASPGVATVVDPGAHELVARAPGRLEWRAAVDVAEGAEVRREVPVLEERAKPARGVWSPRRKWAAALAGVAVVGASAGTYYGLSARHKWRDADPYCNADRSACSPQGILLIDDANEAAGYSNLAFGVSAASAVGAVVLWLVGEPPAPADRPSRGEVGAWRLRPGVRGAPLGVSVVVPFD